MTEYPISNYATYVINGTYSTCVQLYEHGKYRGSVIFLPDSEDPKDAELQSDGKIILNMRINRLNAVLDLLRNEKPIYLFYDSPKNAGIRTGRETIGDDHIWIT